MNAHSQILANILWLKPPLLLWIDELISSDFLRTPRQLVLKVKSKIGNKSKIFLSIEKNIRDNYNLICKANFHEKEV